VNLRRAIFAAGVSTFALSGCSTSYAPRPTPRVAVVMQGGTPVYVREGRVFPGGGFGGDLHEAVEGNPEAESYAKSYRTGMVAGVTTALVGIASAVGGSVLYLANSSGPENERDGTAQAIGGTMALSGIAAYATGMVIMLHAQPHLWDAVNSYNDGVDKDPNSRAYGSHLAAQALGRSTPFAPLPASSSGAKRPPHAEEANAPIAPQTAVPPLPGAEPNASTPAPVIDINLDDIEAK
jgi:hypothetical protein